jgi:tetratricopeptide (TPR) repeat protein
MNSEIENCLSALRDRPQDSQLLQTLENHIRSHGSASDDLLVALDRSLEHHQKQGEWETAVGLIDLQLFQTRDEIRRLELLSLKGRILEEELLEEEAAMEAFKSVLEIEPDHSQTRETIEHIQLIRDNWEKVAGKYIEEANAVADSDRQLSTSLYLSAAEVIWRNQPDDPRVEQFLRRSLEVEPRNSKASAHLERLLRRRASLQELADLYEQRADVAATRETRVAAFLAAGDLWARELGNLEEAAARYKRALSLDPTNPRALKYLVQTLTAQENWSALVRFYEEALRGRPQGAQELSILLQMAMLYNERLSQPEQAEEYYRRVRRIAPANDTMLSFYRGFYREREEMAKLLPLLDSAQRAEEDSKKRIELAKEMAEVAERDVGNLEKAIDIWKGIQRMDPTTTEAMVALKRLYRQTQPPKWNALRELIKEQIDALGETPEEIERKVELLLEVVEIYRDHLKLDVMVINTYNAILALRPSHPDALQALTDKYEALGRWNDLIGLLQRRKEVVTGDEEKIATLHRIAGLWIERFGNQTQAITPLQEILSIDPREARALARLKEIFQRRRNWRELMELYRIEVKHADGGRRRELFTEMGRLAADKLGEPREAIQVWNLVLEEEDPADPEALEELSNLYRREGRWMALAEVLHRRVEAVREQPEQASELLQSLGEIYTNKVRAVDNAIRVWREVLELKPDSAKAHAVLRELLVQEGRWEELELLFAADGAYAELAETLATAADRTADKGLKVKLYTRVGELARDRLDHTERAMKAFERVMAIDAQNVDAARALVPLYADAERWGRLLRVHEVLYEQAPGEERLEYVDRIRELYETHLESRHLAFQWSRKGFALAPDDERVQRNMERLADESDSWEEVVEVYVDRLPAIEDPESRATMLRHLAALCADKLHRPEDAEVFHRDLLELHPEDLHALEALEQIYSSNQRWDGLVDIYRRRASMETGEDRVRYLFKVAFILEERMGDPVGTIQTLREILEQDPQDGKALRSLARLYEVRGEWFPMVDALQSLLKQVAEPAERVELLHGLGEVLQSKVDAVDEGIGVLAEALELDPRHRGTVQALERHLVPDGPHRVRVAELLQPVYERAGDWENLVRAVEILLDAEESREGRLVLLRKLMGLQERRFENLEAAFVAGSSILTLDPSDREIRLQMTQLAERLDRLDELATLMVDVLTTVRAQEDAALELTLSWELALILDEQLGRSSEAEQHLRRIIEIKPDHLEAYDTLERILRDEGDWTGLRDLLSARREQTAAAGARRDILLQIAALNENVLDDIPAAITAYEEILGLEPDNHQSLRALERHYADEGRFRDLLDLYRREMEFTADPTALNELKLAQADLLVHRLEDYQGGADLLEEIVLVDPGQESALQMLEELLGTRDELRRRITEILEPAFDRLERWDDLVRMLLVRKDLTEDRFEAVELLCRTATLKEERLSEPDGAFDHYREALALDPAAMNVHEAIRRLATQLERWEEAARSWHRACEELDAADVALRTRLLMWVADTYDDRLSDPGRAKGYFEQLLELDPDNPETAHPAAAALARIYEQEGQWEELVKVLRRQLGWAEDEQRREALLLRVGQIQEDVLGNTILASQTYKELLDESPGSEDALDALERLYLHAERWAELVEIYQRRVRRSETAEERRDHLVRIAGLQEEELHQSDEAVAAYLTILDELPRDLDSLRALARIYRQGERWADLLEMLERLLALAEDEERVDLLFDSAILEHHKLLEPGVAIERYRRILEIRPDHRGALEALEDLLKVLEHRPRVAELLAPIYRDTGDWEKLIRIHELLAETSGPTDRILHLREVARLCEEGIDSPERALDAYRRAVLEAASEPELLELIEEYRRVTRMLERWPELVETLEGVVVDVLDPSARTSVHLTVATVARDELGELERARDHFHQVLDADPVHAGALEALDEIYQRLEAWEGLLEIVNRRVELAATEHDRCELLVRSARICRDLLERPSEAIAAFERVLELAPGDVESTDALDSLYTATERWVDLAQLIEQKLERTADFGDRAPLYFRLGRLRAERLEDHARAVEAYREALSLEPSHEEVVRSLEGYLEDPDLQAEAARILQPYYVSRQDWNRLIRIYQIRLEAADDPEDRLATTTRIAQLYEEQLEDLEGAFTWYSKVYLEKPADIAIRDQILRLAGILDRWEEVAKVLALQLDQTYEDDSTTRTAAIILGGIYDEKLYKVDQAVACYRRVLENNRLDSQAFELLESLLTRAERWQDLLELYRETSEATDDLDERRELMLKICRVWEEALYNLPEAIDAFRSVLDLSDRDAEALEALDRLYTETERWHDLCDLLVRQIEMKEDPAEILEIRYRLGTICELRMEDLPAAIDYYEEVLRHEPDNPRAIAALERLILDKDQRFRIAQILEPIYKTQDEWAKLVVIYDAQLDFIDDPDRRGHMLREIARLHEERGGSLDLAFRALCRAFEEEFGDEELLGQIEQLAAKLNNWPEVVAVLQKGVERVYDNDLLARIHAEIATLLEQRLGDQGGAVDAWRQVLAAREDHGEAMEALIRLLGALERYEELVEALQRKAELAREIEAQKQTYYRIADILETMLESPGRAIEAFRQVLALDERDRPALDALERLYKDSQNWMELIWVYQQKLELDDDTAERRALQLSIAKVYDEKVADPHEAIAAYKQAMEIGYSGDNAEILDALDRLYTQEALHIDLLEVLERKIELATGAERTALVYRTARLLEREIVDVEGAVSRYREVLGADPQHEETRAALERLVRDEGHRERVASVLEDLYNATGEVERLVNVLELRLELLADPHDRRDLLQRIARLRQDGLEDGRAAFATFARALAEVPEDVETQAELDRLATQLEAYHELVGVYEERLAEIYDTALLKRLHTKVARLAEEVLHDDSKAEEHYRAALDTEGEDEELLRSLDGVLQRLGRWSDLVEVIERQIQVVAEPGRQSELYYRVGELRRSEHDDLDGAFAAFRSALEREATHEGARDAMEQLLENESYRTPVLDVLEPIYEEHGQHDKLAQLLETRLSTLADPLDRTSLLERIAALHEERRGALDDALGAYGRALDEDPGNARVLDQVERLADQLGRFRDVAAACDEILAGEIPAEAVRTLGLRTAEWYGARLSDIERSERVLQRVLAVDPDCMPALEGLERIYRAGGESAQLAEALTRKAEIELDGARRHDILVELARLRSEELGDHDGAIEAWRMVLDQNPSDPEALASLAPLYQAKEVWHDLLDVLDRQAQAADDVSEQLAIKHRIGELIVEKLDDQPRAVDVYRDILDRNPTDEGALGALERIHTSREDWAALQEVLMWRLERLEGEERVPIFQQLATLSLERMDSVDDAVSYYHQILAVSPESEAALASLEATLRRSERWYDLVEVLKRHAEVLAGRGDTAGEVEQLVAAARVWNDQIENPEAAGEVLEEILKRDEENVTALAGLARIYESTQQWDRCREVLGRAASLNPGPKEAAELEFRMGRIGAAQGEDPAVAEQHYRAALEHDPGHRDVIEALEEQYRGEERWEQLAEVLDFKARLEGLEQKEQLAVLQELGRLLADRLGQAERGVAVLELARELDPDNAEVLATLADGYYAADRLDEAEPLIKRLIEVAGTRRRKELARYVHRLGAIAEKRGDNAAAREHYDKAYRMDSTNAPTLVALGRLHMQEQDWEAARRVYRSMLLQNLDQRAGITKADVFYNLGKVHAALDEGAKARSMFERALESDPEHQASREALDVLRG